MTDEEFQERKRIIEESSAKAKEIFDKMTPEQKRAARLWLAEALRPRPDFA